MSAASAPSPTSADFLRDPATVFRFSMEFMVEKARHETYQDTITLQKIRAYFQLVVPADRPADTWLDYQIQEDLEYDCIYEITPRIPGNERFCPRSRRLPVDGLTEVFAWLEQGNIWDWQPPVALRSVWPGPRWNGVHPYWAPFVNLDQRLKYFSVEHYEADYETTWSLEVCRGGRCFRRGFPVYGAPAPSAFAFDDVTCANVATEEVPILANHLAFLNNDPLIVGLTKRLLRLLQESQPQPQRANFQDGQGTSFEVDFQRMVITKTTFRWNPVLQRDERTTAEAPCSEYDRMRIFWALPPSSQVETCAPREAPPVASAQGWSADFCDGTHSWRLGRGQAGPAGDGWSAKIGKVMDSCFADDLPGCADDLLPRVIVPVPGPSSLVAAPEPPPGVLLPLYVNPLEERLQRYRQAKDSPRAWWSGAMLGDLECMLKLARRHPSQADWYDEACRLGNPEAMVVVAHRLLGIVPESDKYLSDEKKVVDANGRALALYQAAFAAGYMPAALGLGFLHHHGIGLPADHRLAVSFYLQSLGYLAEVPDLKHAFAYLRLRDLYREVSSPLYDRVQSVRFERCLAAAKELCDLRKAERELESKQREVAYASKGSLQALARLAEAPSTARLMPRPIDEYEVVCFDDFSDFQPLVPRAVQPAAAPVYLPMFCAVLEHKSRPYNGSVTCLCLREPSGVVKQAVVRSLVPYGHTDVTFLIPAECAHLVVSADLDSKTALGGAYQADFRLILKGAEVRSGSPEWDYHWADYRRLMRLLRSRLGDVSDHNHPARRRYVDHLQETGAAPDPLLQDCLDQVGSVLSAERMRRQQLCLVLARTMQQDESLSPLALAEASRETAEAMPSWEGPSNDVGLRRSGIKRLLQAYIYKRCPWYVSADSFLQLHGERTA